MMFPVAELKDLLDTEFIAGYPPTVAGKKCVGCLRWDKAIMISFTDIRDDEECFDLFLTTEQAEKLKSGLIEELDKNRR